MSVLELWIKLKFSKVKVCMVVVYGPTEERIELGNGYKLFVLGYLNGCVGERMRVDITCGFDGLGENDNRRSDLFEHKSFHKYARVARDQDGVKVMSLIELVLVKKDILGSVQDVRGLG